MSENSIPVFVHNVRSLSNHIDDKVSDNRITSNNILLFTETQINPWRSTCRNIETLHLFNISFNKNEKGSLSLAYGCRNDVNKPTTL